MNVSNILNQAGALFRPAPAKADPAYWEVPTTGDIDTLQLKGNFIFRGWFTRTDNSLSSYKLDDLTLEAVFEGPTGHDGIEVMFADENYVGSYSTCGAGATTYIWQRNTGKLIAQMSSNRFFAQQGKTLLINTPVKQTDNQWPSIPGLWDLSEGRFVRYLENAKPTETFPFIEGDLIFVQQPKGVIGCWDRSSGAFVKNFGEEREAAKVRSIFVDQNVVIAYGKDAIRVWDRKSDQLLKTIHVEDHNHYVETINYKDDLLQINASEYTELWNIGKGERVYSFEGLQQLCSDHDSLFFANGRSEIEIRDKADGKLKVTLEGHPLHRPIDIKCASLGDKIVSSSKDGLKVWGKEEGSLLAVLSDKPIAGMVVNKRRVVVQEGEFLKMWDL